MMKVMRGFLKIICPAVLLSLILGSGMVAADQHKKPPGSVQGVAPNRMMGESSRGSRPGISNQRAASLVKQRYSSSRILGVSLLDDGGPPIYRVRTLSPNGVVKSVFVDANSGEVFE